MKTEDCNFPQEEKNGLTDLLRREFFLRRAVTGFEICIEEGAQFYSFAMIDTDDFKSINDLDSDDQGDFVLMGIGDVLKGLYKEGSIQCISCRYGGEEFMVSLHGANMQIANNIAENIRNKIKNYQYINAETNMPNYHERRIVTASIGVACAEASALHGKSKIEIADAIKGLIRDVDTATKYAKFLGKDRVVCYCKEVQEAMERVRKARTFYFKHAVSKEKARRAASHSFMESNPDIMDRFLYHSEFVVRELGPEETRILACLADKLYSMTAKDPSKNIGFMDFVSELA